jgi:hypothetical protein
MLLILRSVTRFTFICFFSLFLLVITSYVVHAESDISTIKKCLPLRENGVTALAPLARSFTIIAKAQNNQNTGKRQIKEFFLLNSRVKGEKNIFPLETTLIGVDTNNVCFNYEPLLPPAIHLNKFMSQETARNLALQKYQWILKQPGGKAYIQSKLKVESVDYTSIRRDNSEGRNIYVPDATYLIAEEAWALKKLGFSIPKEVAIYPVAKKIWTFPNDQPINFIP